MQALRPYWNGLSRRDALCVGALGGVGLSLPQLLRAESALRGAREKSVILIVPWGGPAQLDTLDLKPQAPQEVRGQFRPIATSVPGMRVCEHLPRLARLAGRYAVIRSMSHRLGTHNPGTHYVLTGHPPALTAELSPARRGDWPSLGAVLARLRPALGAVPAYVQLPLPLVDQGVFSGGQHAGFLGTAFDPLVISRDPNRADFQVPGLEPQPGLTPERFGQRRDLLAQLDGHAERWHAAAAVQGMGPFYRRAYDLLRSAASGRAFDIHQEPAAVRERYGRTRFGQSVLLARRLIESGVRLVLVGDTLENTNEKWDTHGGDAYAGIRRNLAETDLALSALLEDLHVRGLLESTLVLWMAEFGRTPRMSSGGGRDHWPHCYSLMLAGGGVRGGQVYGSSDAQAAYPSENPVRPEDLHATLYTALGIPLDTVLADPLGRPYRLCEGSPVRTLI